MKTKLWCACAILSVSTVAQAEYVYNTEPALPCSSWEGSKFIETYENHNDPNEDTYFPIEQCNNNESTVGKNFFIAYAKDELQSINDVFNTKLADIEKDNQAGAHTLTTEVTALYRTYEQCLAELCRQVSRDCLQSKAFGNEDRLTCNAKKQTLSEVYEQVGLPALTEKNLHTKKTSLLTEHLNAISHNFDRFLHPRVIEANKQLDKATKSILALAKQLWTQ